jgi:hypothetical protein
MLLTPGATARYLRASDARGWMRHDTHVALMSAPLLSSSSAASLLLRLTAMCNAVRPDGPAGEQKRGKLEHSAHNMILQSRIIEARLLSVFLC